MIKLHLSRLLMLVALAGYVSKGFAATDAPVVAEEKKADVPVAAATDTPAPAAADVAAVKPAVEAKVDAPAVVAVPEAEPKDTHEALEYLKKDMNEFALANDKVTDKATAESLNESEEVFDTISDVLGYLDARIALLEKGTGVKSTPQAVRKHMKDKKTKIGFGKTKPGRAIKKNMRKLRKGAKAGKKQAKKTAKTMTRKLPKKAPGKRQD